MEEYMIDHIAYKIICKEETLVKQTELIRDLLVCKLRAGLPKILNELQLMKNISQLVDEK